MTTEGEKALIKTEPPLSLATLGDILHKSGMFADIQSAAQAIVKVMAGRELGFGPIYSMTKIALVKNRITLSAESMAALIKRSGTHGYRVTTHTDKECSIDFLEGVEKVYTSTFTIADAQRAGVIKADSGWEKFPRAMLFARALSQGARIVCPHLIAGAYTHEELGALVDEEGNLLAIPAEQEPDPAFWCEKHKTEWFKKGQMRGYAHPVEGESRWCSQPAVVDTRRAAPAAAPQGPQDGPEPQDDPEGIFAGESAQPPRSVAPGPILTLGQLCLRLYQENKDLFKNSAEAEDWLKKTKPPAIKMKPAEAYDWAVAFLANEAKTAKENKA